MKRISISPMAACCQAFFILCVSYTALPKGCFAADWPQLQRDPQRTGRTDDEVMPPYELLWIYNFKPDTVCKLTQPVTSGGRVFVPTQRGVMHCFEQATGKPIWKRALEAPVYHTAACAGEIVVAAAYDGAIHALRAATGELAWSFREDGGRWGFSGAPCVAGDRIFAARRDGTVYALDMDGKKMWATRLDAPVFSSPAWNDGRLFVGADDLRLYALDGGDGSLIWKSERFYGCGFDSFCPVVAGGKVMMHANTSQALDELYLSDMMQLAPDGITPEQFYARIYDPDADPRHYFQMAWFKEGAAWFESDTTLRYGQMPDHLMKAQDTLVEFYREHPWLQSFFVLDEKTGKQCYIAPHFRLSANAGPSCPPAIAKDGFAIIPWSMLMNCWAMLDLEKGRAVRLIMPRGQVSPDENNNISIGGRHFYALHLGGEHDFCSFGIYDMEQNAWVNSFPMHENAKNQQSKYHKLYNERGQAALYDNRLTGHPLNQGAGAAAVISDGLWLKITPYPSILAAFRTLKEE